METIDTVKEWIEELGYVTNKASTGRLEVASRQHPKAKVDVWYYSDGVTLGYSGRKLKRKKTIQENIKTEAEDAVRRQIRNQEQETAQNRGKDILRALGLSDTWRNRTHGKSSDVQITFQLHELEEYKHLFKNGEMQDNTISLSETNKTKVSFVTTNLEIYKIIPELVKNIEDLFMITGI